MLDLYKSLKDGPLDLGALTVQEKFKHSPIPVSVGKSKGDTFDTVMINMNIVKTVKFNIIDEDTRNSAANSERHREQGSDLSDADSDAIVF